MPLYCQKCGHNNSEEAKFCRGCGEAIITAQTGPLKPGTILDRRYEIKRLVKAGGMGAVYEAFDKRFDMARCAVKEMLSLTTDPEGEKYFIESFRKEADILHELKHPSLPAVKNYFVENGRYYLVMDYIEGRDLDTVMSSYEGGVPEGIVIQWSKEILQALEYLHSQSPPIIYRDMKPANVMVRSSDDRIMLIDFGIARSINPEGKTLKTIIGTPAFSPEELFAGMAETRSDIYSLGATMHCLLTGIFPTTPFNFTPVRQIKEGISPELEEIVMKALARKADDRYRNVKEMREALEKLNDSRALPPTVISTVLSQDVKSSPRPETVLSSGSEGSTLPSYLPPEVIPSPESPETFTFAHKKKNKSVMIVIGAIVFFLIMAGVFSVIIYKKITVQNYIRNGKAMEEEKKYEEAIKFYDKALALDSHSVIALNNKALLLYKSEKYDEAIKIYDLALEIQPDYETLWNNEGLVYLAKGNYSLAVECFEKAVSLKPDNALAWFNRGCALYKNENYEEAVKSFDKTLELNPGDEDAINWKEKAGKELRNEE